MNFRLRLAAAAVLAAALSATDLPQRGDVQEVPPIPSTPPDTKLPNGKSQRDEILKAEHKQNVKDAADLVALTQLLQQEIEKNDSYVFSIHTLKKTDDIEKLVKKLRSRMLHN